MILDPERFRLWKLEDGEQVVRLRGKGHRAEHRSDHPHAGLWGMGVGYVLVPCSSTRSVNQRVTALGDLGPISNRSSDVEVLLIGPESAILALVTEGPSWCRALTRKHLSPERRAALAQAGRPFLKISGFGCEAQPEIPPVAPEDGVGR